MVRDFQCFETGCITVIIFSQLHG